MVWSAPTAQTDGHTTEVWALSVPIGGAIVVYTQEQQQEKEQGGDSDVNALEDGGGGQNDSEGSLEMTEQGKGKAHGTAAEGVDN
jgi:hypothetical protein